MLVPQQAALDADEAEKAAAAVRADQQHEWVRARDERGCTANTLPRRRLGLCA